MARCLQVLLDCEGLDAHDQSEQRSAALLSLASQLSSFFVYNHNDLVGASFLEHLALGLQRSNRLLRNSKSEYTDSDAASEDDVDAGRLDQDADDDCPHTARRSSAVSVLSGACGCQAGSHCTAGLTVAAGNCPVWRSVQHASCRSDWYG